MQPRDILDSNWHAVCGLSQLVKNVGDVPAAMNHTDNRRR
jgi:hypothetical protein